jgi:hypothetical protein
MDAASALRPRPRASSLCAAEARRCSRRWPPGPGGSKGMHRHVRRIRLLRAGWQHRKRALCSGTRRAARGAALHVAGVLCAMIWSPIEKWASPLCEGRQRGDRLQLLLTWSPLHLVEGRRVVLCRPSKSRLPCAALSSSNTSSAPPAPPFRRGPAGCTSSNSSPAAGRIGPLGHGPDTPDGRPVSGPPDRPTHLRTAHDAPAGAARRGMCAAAPAVGGRGPGLRLQVSRDCWLLHLHGLTTWTGYCRLL